VGAFILLTGTPGKVMPKTYPSLKAQFAGCLFQGAEAPCSLRNFMGPKPDAALGTTDEQLDV
jgi:hypothetical protein